MAFRGGACWRCLPRHAKGKKLGRIVHGQPETTNIAFGGDDWKTLYFTTRSTLGSVKVKIAGIPVPVAKKS
jgi:sugar lactone lactonase YvrE